jgi:putative membrane protein
MASRRTAVALFVGLGAFVALAVWQGVHIIAERLGQVGPRVLWLPLLHAPALFVTTVAWMSLGVGRQPRFPRFLFARWVGFAVNQLLPVARVGGDIARGRLLLRHGAEASASIGSVLADKTTQVASIPLFAGAGIATLAWLQPGTAMVASSVVGALGISVAVAGLFAAQRKLDVTARWVGRFLPPDEDRAEAVAATQRALDAIYGRPLRILFALVGHSVFRFFLALEIWLALTWSGAPVSLAEALVVESLGQVLRAGAFMIPGALGAQEGSFVLLSALFGVPAPAAISASLCRRARELLLGVPGLLAWQGLEGRAAWRRSAGIEDRQRGPDQSASG